MFSRKLFFVFGVLLFTFSILAGGCGSKTKKKAPQVGEKIYPVSVTLVSSEDIPDVLEIKGNFFPSDRLTVKSEVEGKVSSVSVAEGQSVAAGETLATINPEPLRLLLEKQRLELKEAEAKRDANLPLRSVLTPPTPPKEVSAAEALAKSANPYPETFDEVGEEPPSPAPTAEMIQPEKSEALKRAEEATVDRIKADIALTEKKLEAATVSSGISGMVTKKNITEGTVVAVGEILFEIVKIDPLFLSIFVPKEIVGSLRLQDRMDVSFANPADQTVMAEVAVISPDPDLQNKNYEVKLSVSNLQQKLKAGMSGKVVIPLEKARKGLLIPEEAVIQKEGSKYVYVVQAAVAEKREVELGGKIKGEIEVKKGLKPDEEVVVKGHATFDEDQEFVKVESRVL